MLPSIYFYNKYKLDVVSFAGCLYAFSVCLLQSTIYWRYSNYTAIIFTAVFLIFLRMYPGFLTWELSSCVLLLVSLFLSYLFAPFSSFVSVVYAYKVYFLFLLVFFTFGSLDKFTFFLWACFLGALIVVVSGVILGEAGSFSEFTKRQVGISKEVNAYGFIISTCFYTSFILAFIAKAKTRLFIVLSWFVIFVGTLGCGSRQVFVIILSTLLVYFLIEVMPLAVRDIRKVLVGSLVLLVVSYSSFFYVYDSVLFKRLVETDLSGGARVLLIKDSLDLFYENPLFGVGPGGIKEYTDFVYSHNAYVELLSTSGIFSFLAYLLLLVVPFLRYSYLRWFCVNDSKSRKLLSAILSVLLGLMVAGMFNVTHVSKTDTILLAAIASFSYFCKRKVQSGCSIV